MTLEVVLKKLKQNGSYHTLKMWLFDNVQNLLHHKYGHRVF